MLMITSCCYCFVLYSSPSPMTHSLALTPLMPPPVPHSHPFTASPIPQSYPFTTSTLYTTPILVPHPHPPSEGLVFEMSCVDN